MIVPSLIFILIYYFYPLTKLIPQSFIGPDGGVTFALFYKFFSSKLCLQTLVRTIQISALVTGITLLLGYPYAYLTATSKPKVAAIFLSMVVLSFWISLLVRTYSWMVLLQRFGIINQILLWLNITDKPLKLMYNQFSVAIGMVHVLIPFMIMPIYSVIKGIDRNLVSAAMTMGASPSMAFLKVTLPLSLNGVAAGVLLVFVQSLGFYVTPMLLGGPQTMMISSLIDRHMLAYLDWPFGAAISMVLLVFTVIFMLGFDRFFGLDKLNQAQL